MDPLQGGGGSSRSQKNHSDATLTEHDEKEQPIILDGSNIERETQQSCSSSSDDSSEEDLFQFDIPLISNLTPDSANPHLASNSANAVASLIDDDTICLGHQPANPPSFEHDELIELGPKQSPPIQVMNSASDVPDPNRIPPSVFTRTKSTTPMEWSVASNESLFSIHVGNSSFTRDHVFLSDKSGELLSNYSSGSPLDLSAPVSPKSDPSPLITNAETVAEGGSNAAAKNILKDGTEGGADLDRHPAEKAPSPSSASLSRCSDSSATSFRSFAFPILTGERSGSIKVEPEIPVSTNSEQAQQPATAAPSPAGTPKVGPPSVAVTAPAAAAENRWFPCCSCCPFCSC